MAVITVVRKNCENRKIPNPSLMVSTYKNTAVTLKIAVTAVLISLFNYGLADFICGDLSKFIGDICLTQAHGAAGDKILRQLQF